MAIVLHLTLISGTETSMLRSMSEEPYVGSAEHFTVMEIGKDIPLKAAIQENHCEFNLFYDKKLSSIESTTVFCHTLPEAIDMDKMLQTISESFRDQVVFARLLKRTNLYPSKNMETKIFRKDSIAEVMTFSPETIILSYALNFLEHSNGYIPPECCEPVLLQIISKVYVGIEAPPEEMSEKEPGQPPSTIGLLQLPHCINCLLLLDETFSGIEGFLAESVNGLWPESRKICVICKALRQQTLTCFQCENIDDIWVCLDCGFPGCGRYAGGHSLAHYLERNHNFAVNKQDRVIWSYDTDNFVHRVQIRDALFYHENPRADTGADNRDLNLLEQNLSALLCEQLDTQRTYFESKIEQKREEIKREVTVNSDTKVKELSKLKETLQEELNEKKTQYSFIRKNRVILEQKIENIRRSVQEEETIKENLESHLNYIQSEQEDPTTKALEKDIENQKQLLEGFRKKLDELYQSLG